ncbi:MAG: MarR family transcriptional regulator [Aeromicrobium sp.]
MNQTPGSTAEELRLVVVQLVRRFRQDRELPPPQFNALSALSRSGPLTTSQLALQERVRPQSMAHTVRQLDDAGLVVRREDPGDGRQTLIEISESGRKAMTDFRRTADAWVNDAIKTRLTAKERSTLEAGIALMRRLVDE